VEISTIVVARHDCNDPDSANREVDARIDAACSI
jgi:hypothetical protein